MADANAHTLRLGILASGGGSNLGALIEAIGRGDLRAEIGVVIANHAAAGALDRARAAGVPALHISDRTHPAAIAQALADHAVEVVVLAGYLKKLPAPIVAAYAGFAVNIHPAPLPRFGGPGMYGRHVHEAVLRAHVAHSGPTVHLVTDEYDAGAVLAHRPVRVEPSDTPESLAKRVLAAEHDLYWRAIKAHFIDGRQRADPSATPPRPARDR